LQSGLEELMIFILAMDRCVIHAILQPLSLLKMNEAKPGGGTKIRVAASEAVAGLLCNPSTKYRKRLWRQPTPRPRNPNTRIILIYFDIIYPIKKYRIWELWHPLLHWPFSNDETCAKANSQAISAR
jgi:hypothetical protein